MMEKMKISCTWLFFLVFDDDLPISDVFCSHCRRDCSWITLCTMKHTHRGRQCKVIAELIETAALAELFMHTHKNTNNSNNKTVTTLQKSWITRHFFIFYCRWVRLSCNVFKCYWTMFLQTFLRSFKVFLWAMAAIFPHPFQSTPCSWPFPEYIFLIQV